MSTSVRVDFTSPFVDTSVLVASFVEGKERLFPSVAFIRKPMDPNEFEKNIEAGSPLKAEAFLEHCKKVIVKYVDRWCYDKSTFHQMNEDAVSRLKHPLLTAMYNITCGYNPTDPIPQDWNWPTAVLTSTPEAIEGK